MTVNNIHIDHVVPHVFRDTPTPRSHVWRTSLTLRREQQYIIESASGGGKSSLCSFLYGLRTDFDGQILFDSTPISSLTRNDLSNVRRECLALLPQELRLFPSLTAIENVLIKNRLTGALPENEIRQMFDTLGIADKTDTPVRLLSIGQQQRVAIIRTLCQPFSFIILDEPVSHLDAENNRLAAALIEERARSLGAGIITTSVGNPLMLSGEITRLKL